MYIYEKLFENLSPEERHCASMCESMIAYKEPLGGDSDKDYLSKYRMTLGDQRVEEIFNTLKEHIDKHYFLQENVFSDSDGVSYNAFVKL